MRILLAFPENSPNPYWYFTSEEISKKMSEVLKNHNLVPLGTMGHSNFKRPPALQIPPQRQISEAVIHCDSTSNPNPTALRSGSLKKRNLN